MGKVISGLNDFFEKMPGRLRKRRWLVLLVFLMITVFLGAGMSRVIMDNSLDSFFKEDDPVKKEYDRFKMVFGGDEYVYIVYKAADGDIFSDKSLKSLKSFYDAIAHYRLELAHDDTSPLDHIAEIKSLINIKYLEATGDTLFSRSFIGDNLPKNDKEREILRNKAKNHPDYPQLFLSKDSGYGGILLRTDFNSELVTKDQVQVEESSGLSGFDDDEDTFEEGDFSSVGTADVTLEFKKTEMTEYPFLIAELRKIIAENEKNGALEFYMAGTPVLMDFFADAVMKDMGRILGIVLLLITVMLFLLFRSFSAVVWPVVIIVLTIIWVTGFIGWSGIHMSIMFQIIIFLVLAVGVADSVHIMSGYLFFRQKTSVHTKSGHLFYRQKSHDHESALNAVMGKSGLACFLTSTTTAVGLMSLVFVPIRPIAVFGIFSAIGVLTAFVLTVFLMPLMLDLWNSVPKKDSGKNHLVQRLLRKTENTGVENPGKVILVFTILGVILVGGLVQLRIDSNDVDVLKNGYPLRTSYNVINEFMGGTGNMEISIDLKKEDAMKDPEVLNTIESLQRYMETMDRSKVTKTTSLVNVVKDSYKALNNSEEIFYKIPAKPDVLSQTIFLFDNANSVDRRRLVTDDYSKGRIGINLKNMGSIDALAFKETVQTFVDQNFTELNKKYPGFTVTLTGSNALLAIMLDYISWSQIKSFGLSLIVISVILFIVFSNFKAGAIAVVPNLFPILTTFGIMGFWGIPLDMDTLLIAPVIIGLAVDDTIHFLTHYRHEVDKYNDTKKAAISSIREAGQAIAFTSIILSVGFSMFVLSFHNGLSHFGILSAIAIMTAFIADIYLLPALCVFFNIDFKKKEVGGELAASVNN